MNNPWLGLGWSTGAVIAFGTVACGSSDSSRKAICAAEGCDAGEGAGGRTTPGAGGSRAGGAPSSGGAGGGSGGQNGSGGGAPEAGGSSTTDASTPDASDASDASTTDASTPDASDASVIPSCVIPPADAGLSPCAPGTADCDANPNDCETNTATDATSCGRCDRVCGATATCNNGLCGATVILDPPAGVASNWCGGAFTSTTAYMITCWGNNNLSEVRSVPLEPGASVDGTRIRHYTDVTVVALRGILVDGPDVYYGLEGKPGLASNLWKFPLDADGPEDVTVGVAMEIGMRFDDLKLVADTYYWESNEHTAGGQIAPAAIYRRSKTDTASTVLVSTLGVTYNLQVTPTSLLWLEARVSGDTRAYRAPLGGAAIEDVVEVGSAGSGAYMTRQGAYVYWTVKLPAPNGKIVRLHTENPAAVPEDVAINLDRPEGIQTDSGHVYFKQADALYRVPLCGGFPEQLSPAVPAHDAQATAIFHVDDRYVYFAADPGFGTSTLVRVAK